VQSVGLRILLTWPCILIHPGWWSASLRAQEKSVGQGRVLVSATQAVQLVSQTNSLRYKIEFLARVFPPFKPPSLFTESESWRRKR
jgi:hypothetical protein